MKWFALFAVPVGLTLLTAASLVAQDSEKRGLNKHLQDFAPFEGTWTCESPWKAGDEFWAQNEYSIGMNGNFVEAVTSTKNEAGGVYQRYKTTWLFNQKTEKLETYGFTYDGTVTITHPEIVAAESGHPIIRSEWEQPSGALIKQEVQMNKDGKSYQWRVWSSNDGESWEQIMDGIWKKSR